MSSVTQRIKQIKQPKGGYIPVSSFEVISCSDGAVLHEEENISASLVGMAVDYLTRFVMNHDARSAFDISFKGAFIAEQFGIENAVDVATNLAYGVSGTDDQSIINLCKLVTFDPWLRGGPQLGMSSKEYKDINPDEPTIENIRILTNRSVAFFKKYGPVIKNGFTFEPENPEGLRGGNFGGYTKTVDSGDGDFLTKDTLWDFKVSRKKPTTDNTLQIMMYWIMGQHSGRTVFKSIENIGIFNPRFNDVYILPVKNVPSETIEDIEKNVICY